jgi:hypothetical protein
MLDGFDEISPFYKETVMGLLQAIRQTAVEQLWVTTRPHLREDLEDELQQLSYKMEPFSEENQVEFLKTFWSLKDWARDMDSKKKEENKNKLEDYANKLINEIGNSISDKDREFTGIPLQTRMLAEAFEKEVKTFYDSAESIAHLPFQLDLCGLYRRFIERKYDIYQEEKCQSKMDNAGVMSKRKSELKSIRQEHQLQAINVLFTEEQKALFEKIIGSSFPTEELPRIGIVQVSHDGKPHFIHRTFAEYFVAECVVNCLTESKNTSEKLQTFILRDILQNDQYQIIRVFINDLLLTSKPSKEMLKEYGTRIDCLRYDDILIRAALEDNDNIVGYLIESVGAGGCKDTARRMLTAGDRIKNNSKVWHIAAEKGNNKLLQKLRDFAKENLTTEEVIYTLLLATNNDGNTVWHMAVKGGDTAVMKEMWDLAKENLTTEEIKYNLLLFTNSDGNTAWHLAVLLGKTIAIKKHGIWLQKI